MIDNDLTMKFTNVVKDFLIKEKSNITSLEESIKEWSFINLVKDSLNEEEKMLTIEIKIS